MCGNLIFSFQIIDCDFISNLNPKEKVAIFNKIDKIKIFLNNSLKIMLFPEPKWKSLNYNHLHWSSRKSHLAFTILMSPLCTSSCGFRVKGFTNASHTFQSIICKTCNAPSQHLYTLNEKYFRTYNSNKIHWSFWFYIKCDKVKRGALK